MSAPRIGPAPLPQYSEPNFAPAPADVSYAGDTDVMAWNDSSGPSFSDLLDILNPLQHLPIVSTLYRQWTGDSEGAMDDIIGGTLYGGPIGLGVAIANLMVEDTTGKNIGDNIYTALFGESEDDSDSSVAKAEDNSSDSNSDEDAPPPPVAAMAPQAVSTQPLSSNSAPSVKDAPPRSGDFMVFGSAKDSAAPPIQAQSVSSLAPTATDKQSQIARQIAPTGNSVQQGDFMVFGGAMPASSSSTPAALPLNGQNTGFNADRSQTSPAPLRRTSAVPPTTLPQPTTGPGALPGGKSQAIRNPNAPSNDWFANAFGQNMDKYEQSRAGQAPTSLN